MRGVLRDEGDIARAQCQAGVVAGDKPLARRGDQHLIGGVGVLVARALLEATAVTRSRSASPSGTRPRRDVADENGAGGGLRLRLVDGDVLTPATLSSTVR